MTVAVACGIRRLVLAGTLIATLGSCRQFVQYTDELADPRSGRTLLVRAPAVFGGTVGFIGGIPVDIVALPVTYPIYAIQDAESDGNADMFSIIAFPSFVLWKTGVLLAVPFDVLEFLAWRAWRPEDTLTELERERIELLWDDEALPVYPVTPIYPTSPDRS